jgi:hypothetical protein
MFSSILHGKDYSNVNLEKYCSRSSNSLERISFMRECMSVMNLRNQRSLDQPPSRFGHNINLRAVTSQLQNLSSSGYGKRLPDLWKPISSKILSRKLGLMSFVY